MHNNQMVSKRRDKSFYRIRSEKGFTLLELLTAMAIFAILVAIGVPSLSELINRNAVTSEIRLVNNDIAWVRSEAVSRNKFVAICGKTEAGENCVTDGNDQDWLFGWIAFVDDGAGGGTPADGERNGDEEVIRIQSDTKANQLYSIDVDTLFVSSIVFHPRGSLAGVILDGTYTNTPKRFSLIVCDKSERPEFGRALIVGLTGRATPSRDTNTDGIHENARGDNLVCS